MATNQSARPKQSSQTVTNDLIPALKSFCPEFAEETDEICIELLKEFDFNVEKTVNGVLQGINRTKPQGSWQNRSRTKPKKANNQPPSNKPNNNKGKANSNNNVKKDGKYKANTNFKGNQNQKEKKNLPPRNNNNNNNNQQKPQNANANVGAPSEHVKENTVDNNNNIANPNLPTPSPVPSQPSPPVQVVPQVYTKHENYASAVIRGVVGAAKDNKPPQKPPVREDSPAPNHQPSPSPSVQSAPQPSQPQPQSQPQSQPQNAEPKNDRDHNVVPDHTPQPINNNANKNNNNNPQDNKPEVKADNNAGKQQQQPQQQPQQPKAQPQPQQQQQRQPQQQQQPKVQPANNIPRRNVILPGGLFEDNSVEIQFGKVSSDDKKHIESSVNNNVVTPNNNIVKEERQVDNTHEESVDNSAPKNAHIFPEVNQNNMDMPPPYDQDHPHQVIHYPPYMPQTQYPYMDDGRGHMAYVEPQFISPKSYRNNQFRGDTKFTDSSANVPQQGNNSQQPGTHPNMYSFPPMFNPYMGHMGPYSNAQGYYPRHIMYYPGYGANVNTGMGYPSEEEFKYNQGANYYPNDLPKTQPGPAPSNNKGANPPKNTYSDSNAQPGSAPTGFKGNQMQPQTNMSYYGANNMNPSFTYPPGQPIQPNNTFQRQQ